MIRLNVFIQVSESNRAAVLEAAKELEHFVTLVPKIQGLASMKLEKFDF